MVSKCVCSCRCMCVGVLVINCCTGAGECVCVGYMPRLVHGWPHISRGQLTAEVTGQLQPQWQAISFCCQSLTGGGGKDWFIWKHKTKKKKHRGEKHSREKIPAIQHDHSTHTSQQLLMLHFMFLSIRCSGMCKNNFVMVCLFLVNVVFLSGAENSTPAARNSSVIAHFSFPNIYTFWKHLRNVSENCITSYTVMFFVVFLTKLN